jgi:hypothetical protein
MYKPEGMQKCHEDQYWVERLCEGIVFCFVMRIAAIMMFEKMHYYLPTEPYTKKGCDDHTWTDPDHECKSVH